MVRFFIENLKALLAATGFVTLPAGVALAAPTGGNQGVSRLGVTLGISTSLAGWYLARILAGSFLVAWYLAAWVVARDVMMLGSGANFATIVNW